MKLGALLYPDVGLLCSTAKGREHGNVCVEPKPVVAPMAGSDHPSIKVQDALKFGTIECRNGSPIPRMRKRRDDAQALLTFGSG